MVSTITCINVVILVTKAYSCNHLTHHKHFQGFEIKIFPACNHNLGIQRYKLFEKC